MRCIHGIMIGKDCPICDQSKPISGMAMMHDRAPTRGEAFRKDLAALLNKYSLENASDTPDFLLADYLIECLRGLDTAIRAREKWYGRGTSSQSAAGDADK